MEAIFTFFNNIVAPLLFIAALYFVFYLLCCLWRLICGPYTLREQSAMAGNKPRQRMADYFVGSKRAQAARKREWDLYYKSQQRSNHEA